MKSYEKLLLENKAWAAEQTVADPDFFKRLQDQQSPEFLWIGCSDSRVPPNQITKTQPGEMFIHRNIANLVVNTDLNLLSVLQYAVEVLKVKHIIVCGHYGCGGVKAAMTNKSLGLIDHWLKEIKDVIRINQEELADISTDQLKFDRMVEINVREQVLRLAKTSIIQNAWKSGHLPHLHGWVYSLKDGLIKPVCELAADSEIDPVYRFDNL
jgi:carbonic anhydrase